MAQRYLFFNSTNNDRRFYQAQDFADYFGSVLSTGLLHNDNVPGLEVSVETGTMNTVVGVGSAIMRGHLYINDTPHTLTHSIAEPTADRIDRIVLRLDSRNAHRNILLHIKEGVPSANPEPPALQRDAFIYELSLAQVRIRANTATIDPSDITDERLDDDVCGLVYSLIGNSYLQSQIDELEIGGVNLISHNPNDWIEMPFAFETKDYIPVKPETPYTLTDFSKNSDMTVWVDFYGENHNHLRYLSINNNESLTFKTRTNERYVKITIAVDDNVLDKIGNEYRVQLERGGFLTDWKPRIDDVNNSIIVESGENANGHYVKWANGLMICWGQVEATNVTATVQRNYGGYRSSGIPIPFAATFHTSGGVPKVSSYFSVPDLEGKMIFGSTNYSSTQFVVHTINQVTSPIPSLVIGYTAVGRWKDYD